MILFFISNTCIIDLSIKFTVPKFALDLLIFYFRRRSYLYQHQSQSFFLSSCLHGFSNYSELSFLLIFRTRLYNWYFKNWEFFNGAHFQFSEEQLLIINILKNERKYCFPIGHFNLGLPSSLISTPDSRQDSTWLFYFPKASDFLCSSAHSRLLRNVLKFYLDLFF